MVSNRGRWSCVSVQSAVANDGWAYKESYNERYHAIGILYWQCRWIVHVAG